MSRARPSRRGSRGVTPRLRAARARPCAAGNVLFSKKRIWVLDGKADVSVRFADEDVWVTQVQLAELYETTRQNIGQHIEKIYVDNELPREATIKKFFIVQQEGKREVRREIDHYNLDVIIAVGYRVQSPVATRFRRWATARLHGYLRNIHRLRSPQKDYEGFLCYCPEQIALRSPRAHRSGTYIRTRR